MKDLPTLIPHLLYFYDAVRLSSVTKAAKVRLVTQSTISQAIKKLERVLDEKLLDHQPRKLVLTREGKRLFALAKDLFETLDPFEERLRPKGEWEGELQIGFSHSLALLLAPRLYEELKKSHPEAVLSPRILHPDALKEAVKAGGLDYALALESLDLNSFECSELYTGKYCLYQKKGGKPLKTLFASLERPESLELQKQLKGKGFEWVHIPSWELIAEMVSKGLGVGLLPDFLTLRYQQMEPLAGCGKAKAYSIYGFSLPSRSFKFLTDFLSRALTKK